jgi:hypothetical protein
MSERQSVLKDASGQSSSSEAEGPRDEEQTLSSGSPRPLAGAPGAPGPAEPASYPPPLIFAINMVAMYIAIFCVALDNTIISTAVPRITDQFHALNDVGWYSSGRCCFSPRPSSPISLNDQTNQPKSIDDFAAYTLTQCVSLLQFGKLNQLFSPKWTFLASLFVFEAGSLLCALAPSSTALIVGVSVTPTL